MLKIGWSRRDVSTDKPVCIMGLFYVRVSKGVLDPITLTALTIADENDYVIFVSCDLVDVRAGVLDEVRRRVAAAAPEIDTSKILMNATHTHSGPIVQIGESVGWWGNLDGFPHDGTDITPPGEYSEFFIENAVSAVIESFRSRSEGSISYGYGYAAVAHSRRSVYSEDLSKDEEYVKNSLYVHGHARMYGNTDDERFRHYEAGTDHFANFLYTFDKVGNLTGAIVNIPCPSQLCAHEWMLSADFWHDTRCEIRKNHGDIFILTQCAAAGDLSPTILHYKKAQSRRYKLKFSDYKIDERVEFDIEAMNTRRDIAIRISDAFNEVYSWASKEKLSDFELVHSVKTIELDKRLITDEEYSAAVAARDEQNKQELAFITDDDPREVLKHNSRLCASRNRYNDVISRYEKQKTEPKHSMELHVIKMGELAFASNQFELYMDYQHRIQARSPFTQTFVVQLCAQPSQKSGTYLATERGVWGVGYSASMFCNIVSPEGGQQLVDETVKELKRLY
ncbi:MAG: hypothetical protein IKV73_03795 [Clostridia bacterium]|nr:hypothetical protein [Clostridia bacterium]